MLCARYSEGDGVELAGSPEELSSFARDLGRLATIQLAARAAHPYDLALRAIDVRDGDGPLRLSVENDTLVVTGDRRARDLLLKSIASFVGRSSPDDPGVHMHIEWFPGNEFVAEDSEPLVVAFGA